MDIIGAIPCLRQRWSNGVAPNGPRILETVEEMLCPRCGCLVGDGRDSCPKCGQYMAAQQAPQYGGYQQPAVYQPYQQPAGYQPGPQYGGSPQYPPYGGYPQYQQPPPKPNPDLAVGLAALNGIIAFGLAFVYMELLVALGLFLLIIAVLLLVGAGLIGAKQYKGGAVLCYIGGAITIPLGMMGIYAGGIAWNCGKYYGGEGEPSKGYTRTIEEPGNQ